MGFDKDKCGDFDLQSQDRFSLSLSISQKIWFLYVIPTSLCCFIYIADIATDIALVERHFSDNRCVASAITLFLLYAPAVVFFIVTVTNTKKWPGASDGIGKMAVWFLKQVGLLIFFPINAIHRFAGKLFWSLEALICPEDEQEEALAEASKPSTAELYLLLQAFFQAAPQALFQAYVLATFKIPHERTGAIQVIGIMSSIASASIAAACYMRYESQRIAGRLCPWSTTEKNSVKKSLEPKESLMTTIESQITADTIADNTLVDNPSAEEPESPKPPPLPKGVPQSAILSLPPLPPQIRARLLKASGDELPEDLEKDYNVDDGEPLNIRTSIYGPNAKPPRKDKENDSVAVDLMLLPSLSPATSLNEVRAPPTPIPLDIPMDENESISQASNKVNDDDEDSLKEPVEEEKKIDPVPTPLKSPVRELRTEEQHLSREPLLDESTETLQTKMTSPDINYKPIPLPTRKWKIEGLREDDFLGKFIGFVWWFLFITSRVLSMAILAFFYPWAFITVSVMHYIGMVAYLFNCEPCKNNATKVIRLGLGLVYLLCFIEIRTKFKNPKSFTFAFICIGSLESVVSSMIWFFYGEWSSWWFLYAFFLIVTTLLLSLLAMGLYFLILKPARKARKKRDTERQAITIETARNSHPIQDKYVQAAFQSVFEHFHLVHKSNIQLHDLTN